MGIKQQLEADIKTAMLSGDKERAEVLRTVKSTILEAEIAQNKRDQGLSDQELVGVLSKEAKKRQDTAEIYKQANEPTRAEKEEKEKEIISQYLPAQMSDEELNKLIESVISELGGSVSPQQMGQIIAEVRNRSAGQADGGRIAQKVKEKIS